MSPFLSLQNHKVTFDGKEFTGTREEYINKVGREECSELLRQRNGELGALYSDHCALRRGSTTNHMTSLRLRFMARSGLGGSILRAKTSTGLRLSRSYARWPGRGYL